MLVIPKEEILNLYNMAGTISYLGLKIWNLVPENIKNSEDINNFKLKIKFWKCKSCPWRLCKIYLPQIYFIWLGVFRILL